MPAFDPYHKWLGIPPEDSGAGRLNHYRLLGISPFEADAEVIGSAADQRMAHLRSFQTGPHSDLSQTLLNQVTAAKLCLLKPDRKAAYDAELRRNLEPKPVRPTPVPENRMPLRRPLRIAAPLTAVQSSSTDPGVRAGGIELGSLGFEADVSRTSKKSHSAKRRKGPATFWASLVAVMAVLLLIWIASQSDSGSPPNVAAKDVGEIHGPQAGARIAKPAAQAKAAGNLHPLRNPSVPGSGIRENSDVAGLGPAPTKIEPAPTVPQSEPAPQDADDHFAATVTPPVDDRRATAEPKAPPTPAYAKGKSTPLPSNAFVVSLARDNAGCVWVGTEDLGVFRYDPSAAGPEQWTEFTTRDGLGDDNAYALCVDRLNRAWVGHLNHGVSVYNGQSWANYDVPDGPIGERIFSIATDPKSGDIWIATSAGLTRYSLEGDTWTHYTRDDGLPSDHIQSLAFDAKGTLYAGTQCDGLAISDPPPVVSREALAAGQVASAHRRWRQIIGPDTVPLAPFGPGLPSNLINDVLVSRSGVVFVATTCGLAASKDRGKNWAFIRGADWGAKVKGLYGGPPRGWREGPAPLLLTEDYCTSLAEDDAGLLWVGHWRTGLEAIDPATLRRRYPIGDAKTGGLAYLHAILPRPGLAPLVGWYGNGVMASDGPPSGNPKAVAAQAVPPRPANFPSPAGAPTLDELNAMLAKLGSVPMLRTLSPTVVELPDDWRTEGDWLGRYGRYWACCCAICSPEDYIWGAGPEPIEYAAYIGPNHPQKDDSLRYWVHWLATDNRRSLEMPPTYLDSRIKKGLTTPEKNRRQAERDDHSEAYSPTLDGPHVYCTLEIPAGQFYLSLYDFNKDGHSGDNCLRDYRISIHPHNSAVKHGYAAEFERQPEAARGRIHDFWGGVWLRYYVQGPLSLTIQLNKNVSKNTILAGVMLDYVDERPVPYFRTFREWRTDMDRLAETRKRFLAEPLRSARSMPGPDSGTAARSLFDELENARLRNAPWWAAQSRPYYAVLLRWCRGVAAPDGASSENRQVAAAAERLSATLATCCYQLRLCAQWEESQRADKLTPAREVEKALRWDGFPHGNSGHGYRNVLRYLRTDKNPGASDLSAD